MTTSQLIENAISKGYKVNTESLNFVGIQFNAKRYSGLWHWFSVSDNSVWFDHSYSQNTGKSFKGLYHSMNVKTKLGFYE